MDDNVRALAPYRAVKDQQAEVNQGRSHLHSDDGGNRLPPVADSTIEKRVDFLHTAYIALVAAIIAVAVGLATLIFTSANSTNGRIDKANDNASSLNREVGTISTKQDATNARLDVANKRLESMDAKLDALLAKR